MSPTPPPTRRRIRRLAAGLGLGTVAALALATPATANEFPPKPAATAAVKCVPQGGFAYSLTNAGGHVPADFTIVVDTVDGSDTSNQTVQVDATYGGFAPVPEDTEATITISSQYMADVALTETIDCLDSPTARTTHECDALGATMDVVMSDPDGAVTSGWEVVLDGDGQTFPPGDQLLHVASFEEGDAWDLQVLADGVVVLDESGVIDCVQPTAEIELVCTDAGPDLIVRLGRDDVTRSIYDVHWPDEVREPVLAPTLATEVVPPGDDGPVELLWSLPRETDYRVSVSTEADGEIALLEGSSGCPDADVVTDEVDQVPSTPVVPSTYSAPDAVGTYAPGPSGLSGTGSYGTTELARTGSETPWLIGSGTGLLAVGVVLLRVARALLRACA